MRVSTELFLSIHFLIVSLACSDKTPLWRWSSANVRGGGSPSSIPTRHRSPQYYEKKGEDYEGEGLKGMGREFDLFNGNVLNKTSQSNDPPRGGSAETNESTPTEDFSSSYSPGRAGGRSRYKRRRSSNSAKFPSSSTQSSQPNTFHNPFTSLRTWLTENQSSIPRIQVRVEPSTTLKLRKRFRPLFKTVVTLGADFNNQLGVWQFKSSWEDSIIGGRLMLAGRELQLSKTWLLSVGAVEDLVTRLRFRAAIDLGTGKAYARFGFRSERLSPINVVEGFTVLRQLPLDGPDGHVKLEVKANFAFPEPEIEYSTEKGGRSLIGMGDIEVNLDELNLLLDY